MWFYRRYYSWLHGWPEIIGWESKATQRVLMIYRGKGFLAVIWFVSSPTPHPPPPFSPVSELDRESQRPERLLADGRGGWRGWAMSRIIRPQEDWSSTNHLIISEGHHTAIFSSLCLGDDSLILVPGEESGQIGGSRPDLFDFMLQSSCWLPLAPLSCTFFGIPTFLPMPFYF
jgi:hypothetical protein